MILSLPSNPVLNNGRAGARNLPSGMETVRFRFCAEIIEGPPTTTTRSWKGKEEGPGDKTRTSPFRSLFPALPVSFFRQCPEIGEFLDGL